MVLTHCRSHIVTNHFLHFLALDRSDPKKFQVLQLIAALLGWSEEQREQAGLSRPGSNVNVSATGSVRGLMSPSVVHRTPSTPALSNDYFTDISNPASKETLAELWQNFLEQEANSSATASAGVRTGSAGKSTTASQSTASGIPKA